MDQVLIDRFWSKVNKTEDCWEWTAGCFSKRGGYGQFHINRHPYRAHKVSYEMAFGPVPEGLQVCHKCDNTKCVRPDHLFLGTNKANAEDKESKGRGNHPSPVAGNDPVTGQFLPKLTVQDVTEIARLHENGWTISAISTKFKITRSATRRYIK